MKGNPMHALCGAHCRTTGSPCKNLKMPNGRCRMHGGKSTGPPTKHRYYCAEAVAERRLLSALVSSTEGLLRGLG